MGESGRMWEIDYKFASTTNMKCEAIPVHRRISQ